MPVSRKGNNRPLHEEGQAMRTQQRTSWGFDSDDDPRLDIRAAVAALQRALDGERATTDAAAMTSEDDVADAARELEAVGAGASSRQ
jgi:hypothetical protein